jgi:hypothetical protein
MKAVKTFEEFISENGNSIVEGEKMTLSRPPGTDYPVIDKNDLVKSLKKYDKVAGKFRVPPDEQEYVKDHIGRSVMLWTKRLYDEDVTERVVKTHFTNNVTGRKYNIGDEIRLRNGYEVRNAKIIDKKEIPYKNFGPNAFQAHTFDYYVKYI